MRFQGFEEADFDLLSVPGLEPRMEQLVSQLRPKLYDLGEDLRGELSLVAEEPVFPHVAKHARRTTNPPDDTWVAFSSNPRGYKMMPHFQVCIWSTHVLIQWGIIYEAKNKEHFASALMQRLGEVRERIPADFQWSKDHMAPQGTSHKHMQLEDFEALAQRLTNHKNGEVMVGAVIPRAEAISMPLGEFEDTVLHTWRVLLFLHRMAV